jgi:hypothetical protein
LERCFPAEFGRSRIELTGENGSPLAVGVGIYLPAKNAEPPPVQVVTARELTAER